jgi:hypothetical protein
MVDLAALWRGLTSLAGVALRSFALTVVCMILFGFVLAGVSYYLASQTSTLRGVLAALIAIPVSTVAGFIVAGQRAVAVALIRGLRQHRFGETLVRAVFERLLGVSGQHAMGERGGFVAQSVERLPLAQAEARLNDAVTALLQAPAEGGGLTGWLRRRLQARLLRAVRDITLARFRAEGAEHGGVDLVNVQTELGARADGLVINHLRRGTVRMTAGIILVTVVVVIGIALTLQRAFV